MIDLSVIIVNYNVRYYVEQCLRSVFAAQGSLSMEVFVVDNNSSDDSVAYLSEHFPQVHLISNPDNKGFSRANNQAIRQAQGRYILLLNPDTIVTEYTFSDSITYLDQHPEAGACGVAMYGGNGRFAWESRRGVPTPWTAFCKMVGLSSLFPHSRRFGHYYMRYLNREESNYIEIISGAFFMIRQEALSQVGLLDETFFMYGEDIDLSYRLLLGGWRNAYVPTPILHYKGESTHKSSYRYVHIFYQAMLIFFDKHFRHRYRLLSDFIHVAVYLRAGIDMMKRSLQRLLALLPHRQPPAESCLCLGNSDSMNQMREICQRNGFIFCISPNEPHTYTVFDTSCYTYGEILNQLITLSGEGKGTALGTYTPENRTMILPNEILY